MWWERLAKVHIKKLFIREGTLKRREETQWEIFYYGCLYDVLQRPIQHAERRAAPNHLIAKIVKIHNVRLTLRQIDLRTQDIFKEECVSLFYLTKRRQCRGIERSQKCTFGITDVRHLRWIYCVCSVSTCEVNIAPYRLMMTVSGQC